MMQIYEVEENTVGFAEAEVVRDADHSTKKHVVESPPPLFSVKTVTKRMSRNKRAHTGGLRKRRINTSSALASSICRASSQRKL